MIFEMRTYRLQPGSVPEAEKRFGGEAAQQLRILYGGSVKPDNIHALITDPEIDGALVGSALNIGAGIAGQ